MYMSQLPRIGRAAAWPASVVAVALVLVGCSRTVAFPTVSGAQPHAHTKSFSAYDQCLRRHGSNVSQYYDPYSTTSTKIQISAATQSACHSYLPPPPPVPIAVQRQWFAYGQCMASRGFANTVSVSREGIGVVFAKGVGPPEPGFDTSEKSCLKKTMHGAYQP